MTHPLLELRHLQKRFGAVAATADLSLTIEAGELHAIIGPNGAGKTTLVAQIAGELRPDNGSILFDGTDITKTSTPQRSLSGLARTFQITSLFRDFSVRVNVELAVQTRIGHSFRFIRSVKGDPALRDPAIEVLTQVGLASRAEERAGALAHGEQRQLELAIALATRPRLLLLDEPMAGMSREDSGEMVALLRRLKERYTILLIEHDMEAVFALADRISVLVYGQCIATGTPAQIRSNPAVRHAYLGEDAEAVDA